MDGKRPCVDYIYIYFQRCKIMRTIDTSYHKIEKDFGPSFVAILVQYESVWVSRASLDPF